MQEEKGVGRDVEEECNMKELIKIILRIKGKEMEEKAKRG